MKHYKSSDIVIKAAAVADYRPKTTYADKLKKKEGELKIELERTIDILKTLGASKEHQLLVGFAAETEHVEEYAKKKLKTKNLDMIVANNVKQAGAGFGVDTNAVTIYKNDGSSIELPLSSKREIAFAIVSEIISFDKGRGQ
jgi:phosphopantothenoylcysteine decarboxylase/phosphopantothenate--cysteine ligase